jgi:hypothetical protein
VLIVDREVDEKFGMVLNIEFFGTQKSMIG